MFGPIGCGFLDFFFRMRVSILAMLVSNTIWFLYCSYKAGGKQGILYFKSGHKQGRENRWFGFKWAGFGRRVRWSTPPGGGGTVYNRFYSPFLFPTIEDDDDDDSDQTQNSKKNAENYQRVLAGWSWEGLTRPNIHPPSRRWISGATSTINKLKMSWG